MDKQEYLDRINAIGTCEDEAERLKLLNSLRDDVCNIIDENSQLVEQNNNYVSVNENLRNTNMDLFLQLGEQKSREQVQKNETGQEPPKEKRTFENLFNNKGELI